MEKPMMKCGHTANAVSGGKPICVICGCTEIAEQPNLKGRKARCFYCDRECDSSTALPFFEHKPESEFDEYYCGCWGWD